MNARFAGAVNEVSKEKLMQDFRLVVTDAEEYVHENPWRAIGIGAGVGLIVGMLISRGR